MWNFLNVKFQCLAVKTKDITVSLGLWDKYQLVIFLNSPDITCHSGLRYFGEFWNGLFQKKYTPLMDGKLEILAGVGVVSSWNLGEQGNLNRKIFPQGSLLTSNSHIIFEARKKELCNGKSCSLSVYSVLTSYALSVQVFIHVGPVNHEEPAW